MLTGNAVNCQTPSPTNRMPLLQDSRDATNSRNNSSQQVYENNNYLSQRRYNKAKEMTQHPQRRQHQIDIITQSPQEILCLIISLLPIDTRVRCTKVCLAWRKALLQCSEAWRIIKDVDEAYKLLPLISHHIERLCVSNEKVTACFRYMDELIHLQALSLLIDEEKYDAFTIIDADSIYQALKSISGTLTQLKIEWTEAKISLGDILSICKKLKKIQLIVWEVTEYEKEQDIANNRKLLTSISLQPCNNNSEKQICVSKMQPLLRSCPYLQYLRLECSQMDADVSSIINIFDCPDLTTIITDMYSFEQTYKIPDTALPIPQDIFNDKQPTTYKENKYGLPVASDTKISTTTGGLQYLITHSLNPTTQTQMLFEQSKDSLRTLCITPSKIQEDDTFTMMTVDNNSWHRLSSFILSQLTYFQIESCLNATTEFLSTHLPTLLLHMPALETLVMGNASFGAAGPRAVANIYNSITQLSRLQALRFVEFNVYGSGFLHFLEHPPPRLQQLMIYGCNGVTFPVLERMAKIQQLKSIIQLGLDIDVTIAEYTQFLELIGSHPNLSYLEIGVGRLSECRLQSIIQCKSLSTLVLRRVFGLTDKMVTELRNYIQHVIVVSEWEEPPFPVPPSC